MSPSFSWSKYLSQHLIFKSLYSSLYYCQIFMSCQLFVNKDWLYHSFVYSEVCSRRQQFRRQHVVNGIQRLLIELILLCNSLCSLFTVSELTVTFENIHDALTVEEGRFFSKNKFHSPNRMKITFVYAIKFCGKVPCASSKSNHVTSINKTT